MPPRNSRPAGFCLTRKHHHNHHRFCFLRTSRLGFFLPRFRRHLRHLHLSSVSVSTRTATTANHHRDSATVGQPSTTPFITLTLALSVVPARHNTHHSRLSFRPPFLFSFFCSLFLVRQQRRPTPPTAALTIITLTIVIVEPTLAILCFRPFSVSGTTVAISRDHQNNNTSITYGPPVVPPRRPCFLFSVEQTTATSHVAVVAAQLRLPMFLSSSSTRITALPLSCCPRLSFR